MVISSIVSNESEKNRTIPSQGPARHLGNPMLLPVQESSTKPVFVSLLCRAAFCLRRRCRLFHKQRARADVRHVYLKQQLRANVVPAQLRNAPTDTCVCFGFFAQTSADAAVAFCRDQRGIGRSRATVLRRRFSHVCLMPLCASLPPH